MWVTRGGIVVENDTDCRPQLSNYWTANLYFKARNGTYKRVPQIPNRYVPLFVHGTKITNSCSDLFNDKYTGKTKGGFVVYYVSPGKGKVTAFKPVSRSEKRQRPS